MKAKDLPAHYNASAILEQNLESRSGEPALFSEAREATFGDVAREADRVALALRREGLRSGDVVALFLPDSAEWVEAFFGTLKAGGVALGMEHSCRLRPAPSRRHPRAAIQD